MAYGRRRSRYGYGGYGYGSYFHSTTGAEVSALARKTIERAAKKGIEYHQIFPVNQRTVAATWWGKSWCDNLQRYSDFSNRLPRGRKYLNAGGVLKLEISEGQADAVVQGSGTEPYRIRIQVDPLNKRRTKEIEEACSNGIKTMDDLLKGRFPDELKHLFFAPDGLFPRPGEIHFSCSCPDYASMCKHVAAAMYAVGIILDQNPSRFFLLRGIQADKLIAGALDNRVDRMLKNARKKSSRTIGDEEEVAARFGLF